MIELIVSDCDGTLLTDGVTVLPETSAAIKRAMAKGVRFAIATGRFKKGTEAVFSMLGIDPANVSAAYDNGSYLEIGGDPVFDDSLDNGTLRSLTDFSREFNCRLLLYYEDNWFIEAKDKWYDHVDGFYPGLGRVDVLERVIEGRDPQKPVKAVIRADSDVMARVVSALGKSFPQLRTMLSHSNILEIVREGSGKEKAVAAIASHFGIPLSNVMAIGDFDNDLEMIREVGVGVAMQNASARLKSACKFLTLSNNDNGVGYAIDKFTGGDEGQ